MAKMINATFVYQKTGGVNDYANLAFTMFATYLLLSIYIFATYLRGENLCKSIFCDSRVTTSCKRPPPISK